MNAAAGIDHGNRVIADDETDIGDGALVLARHQRDAPICTKILGATSRHRQFLFLRLR